MSRRSKIEIVRDILTISRSGARKTKMMYKAKLSFDQLQIYLSALKEKGWITEENSNQRPIYKTSEKGLEVLKKCEEVNSLLNNTDNKLQNLLKNSYN